MGNHPGDVVLRQSVALGDGLHGIRHLRHGMLEDRAPLLIDEVLAPVHTFMRRHLSRTASRHVQVFVALLDAVVAIDESHLFLGGLHHDAARPVAKDGARVAVLVVGHRRHVVAAAHDDAAIAPRADVVGCHLHGIEETGTGGLHVEAEGLRQTRVADDQRGRRGEVVVRRRGGTDKHLHALGVHLRLLEQLPYGPRHQVAGAAALFGLQYVARLHADALHYPFVTVIDDARHLLVVEDVVGHISTDTRNHCINLFHYLDIRKMRK